MVNGIDVSRWQGNVNWSAVKQAGYAFAYIKATEGVGYVSPTLDGQMAGARAAGLVVGAYHYARPGNNPADDARTFAAELRRLSAWQAGNLPPCLDMEEPAGNAAGWVRAFIDTLRAELGRREVMVYASSSYVTDQLGGEGWADDGVTLWVAHYGRQPGKPGYLSPRVVMHQHSSTGHVPGVAGNCDLNVCLVDLAGLAGGTTPPPGPGPEPGRTYTVVAGDTLSEIGARLGVDWHDIAHLNGINPPYTIYPNQVLTLPGGGSAPSSGRTYTVKAGDTLSEIGAEHGIDWHDIARVNEINAPYTIYPGQQLSLL